MPDSQPDFKLLQIRLILIKDNGDGSTYDGMIDNVALAQTGGLAIVDRGFPRWWNRSLTGFDAIGNPQWSAWSVLASASGGISDPVPHLVSADPPQSPITSSNILVSYDQSLKQGWHLGGIRAGDNKWVWKASPSSTLEDFVKPIGNYEIGHRVGNGGNVVTTSGRHVIAGYHGEGYRSFQASQFMHFYDDGLFIGQFGTPNTDIFYNLLPTETVLTGPVEN